jgi:hypothetical protein
MPLTAAIKCQSAVRSLSSNRSLSPSLNYLFCKEWHPTTIMASASWRRSPSPRWRGRGYGSSTTTSVMMTPLTHRRRRRRRRSPWRSCRPSAPVASSSVTTATPPHCCWSHAHPKVTGAPMRTAVMTTMTSRCRYKSIST